MNARNLSEYKRITEQELIDFINGEQTTLILIVGLIKLKVKFVRVWGNNFKRFDKSNADQDWTETPNLYKPCDLLGWAYAQSSGVYHNQDKDKE
jgi:hypothetical protein